MEEIILEVKNLVKRYNNQKYPVDGEFVLDISHLVFQKGKIYSLVGPNGAGKTTLLNLLSLLERPTEGEIFFQNCRISGSNALGIRRRMSMVMENPYLFQASVFKNITSGLTLRRLSKEVCVKKAKDALKIVGLEGFEKKDISALSQGEAKLAAIGRSIVLEPEILFLDEPFANIDKWNIQNLERLIKSIKEKYNTTIIFATHDILLAQRLSDKVIALIGGKIAEALLENFFSGEAKEEQGLQFVRISPSIRIAVLTQKRGRVQICIHPQDIILSASPIQSSARNSFKGAVKKIYMEGEAVRLNILIEEEREFIALVTKISYQHLGLSIDSPVVVSFKATSVEVF